MFYIEKDNRIVLAYEKKSDLENALLVCFEYAGLEIKETDRPIINCQFADTEEFKQQQAEQEKLARILEIKSQLIDLDTLAVRPLRAILTDCGTDEDKEKLKDIEMQASNLRVELQLLGGD